MSRAAGAMQRLVNDHSAGATVDPGKAAEDGRSKAGGHLERLATVGERGDDVTSVLDPSRRVRQKPVQPLVVVGDSGELAEGRRLGVFLPSWA